MLTAVVAHPPPFGAKVKIVRRHAAQAVKGVVDVVEIPRGVAVVAESTWAAMKGREALTGGVGRQRRGDARLRRADGRVSSSLASGTDAAVARNERRCRRGDRERGQDRRGDVRVPLSRARRAGAAGRGGADAGRRARDLGRASDARSLPGVAAADRRHPARQGEAARDDDRRRLRPARGDRCRRHRRGGGRSPRRSAGRRRSRCSGPARTTWPAAATGRCTSTRDQRRARRGRQPGRLAASHRRPVDPDRHARSRR